MQRARDGRSGERKHVDVFADILDRLLMLHAEALLLVDNEQAQILELDLLAQQPVRADDQIDLARLQLPHDFGLFLRRAETAEHLAAHGKAFETALDGVIMLLREHRRRHKNGRLLSVGHAFERGAQRHLGLAVPHVAAQKTIHRGRRFHVLFDILDRLQLVWRFLEGEIVLELALPCAVRAEGVALLILALGVEFDQIERHFLNGGLCFLLLLLPLVSAEAVDLGRRAVPADELLHAVHLIGRHVQLVVPLILDKQIIAPEALALQAHCAAIHAHAVRLMHDVIAHRKLGKRLDALPRRLSRAPLFIRRAVQVRVRDDGELPFRAEEAVRKRERIDDRFARRKRRLAGFVHSHGNVHLGERFNQAFAARRAAGQQRHAPAVLLPALHVAPQLGELVLIRRRADAVDFDDLLRMQPAHRAQEGEKHDAAFFRHPGEKLRAVEQQRRLLRQRLALLERRLKRFGELKRAVIARLAQLVRLVHEDDRAAHPIHYRIRFRIQQRHERFHIREAAAFEQLLRVAFCARGKLILRRTGARGVEKLPGRAVLVHIGKQFVKGGFRFRRRALERLVQRVQQPRRRLARVALVHERQFHRRAERSLLQILDRALRRRVEAADGIDLVVEPFHADRSGPIRRKHVENAAAHGEFAAPFHLFHARVSRARQMRAHGLDIRPRAHAQLRGQREHALRRHQPVLQRFNRGNDHARLALCDGEEHLHAAMQHVVTGGGNVEKRRFPRRQQIYALAHQLQKIVVAARGLRLHRHDEKRRPAGFPGQRRRKKRLLRLRHAEGGYELVPLRAFEQLLVGLPAAKRLIKEIPHASLLEKMPVRRLFPVYADRFERFLYR